MRNAKYFRRRNRYYGRKCSDRFAAANRSNCGRGPECEKSSLIEKFRVRNICTLFYVSGNIILDLKVVFDYIYPVEIARRNSYHSVMIIAFQAGLLSDEILKRIPTSTLYNWKTYDTSKLVNYKKVTENVETFRIAAQYARLLAALRGLVCIIQVYQDALGRLSAGKKALAESREKIIRIFSRFEGSVGRKHLLRWMNISKQQLTYWKRDLKPCPSSLMNACRRMLPQQLTGRETGVIREYLDDPDHKHWPVRSVYYQMMRDLKAFCSLSTFYRYARLLGRSRKRFKKKERKIGIRASEPGEIMHADITIVRLTDGTPVNVYHFCDNRARFVYAARPDIVKSSEIVRDIVRSIVDRFPDLSVRKVILMVDGGSENKGALDVFLGEFMPYFTKKVGLKDIEFSNSMIESSNRTLKGYIDGRQFAKVETLDGFLEWYVNDFNNRPHGSLFGFTPAEVMNGQIPDKHHFAEKIAAARIARVAVNQAYDCSSC